MAEFKLVGPAREYLPTYIEAFTRGWLPDNMRPEAADEELQWIAADPDAFLASQVDRQARWPPIMLPDGSTVRRLPGFNLWMWDGEFCGRIGFRWQPGTEDLPAHCLGHIGYTVVPWKRRLSYATRALGAILPDAWAEGLRYVEITTDPDNVASQRVIERNGGVLVDEFLTVPALGGTLKRRYRIYCGDRMP